MVVNNKITQEKLDKYRNLTEKALDIAKKSIINGKSKEAKEIDNGLILNSK